VLGVRVTRFEDGTANSQVEGSDDDGRTERRVALHPPSRLE